MVNEEIDQMRHAATSSLLERRDTIIIASVSCIYGIGDPEDYRNGMVTLRIRDEIGRDALIRKLVNILYVRNDIDFNRGCFRVRGDVVEILPSNEKTTGIRVEFDIDTIRRIRKFHVVTGDVLEDVQLITLFPASHFLTNRSRLDDALTRIREELIERLNEFKREGKLLEAERLEQRTMYDLELLQEMGTCPGVENYSRHLALRGPGETPTVLIDFFPKDFLLVVDESHVTIPQVRGMFNGDRNRKQTLIDYGFRLPSALDNRPLNFDEFQKKIGQVIYCSATPGDYELETSGVVVEQIIRPTGLLDPVVDVRKSEGQIDDLLGEIETTLARNERVLITTLTIKMSEDLTEYLKSLGYKVAYLHSEVKSLERLEILRKLRLGTFDILVGINLLREGIDLPEVSLIAILDADKEGFLRSDRSLIQIIGRAARNVNGHVIMYGDKLTDSMKYAIEETTRRRSIQSAYNIQNNITPKTVFKAIHESISIKVDAKTGEIDYKRLSKNEIKKSIEILERQMRQAAKDLDFERAAELRDIIMEMKGHLG
jgi:excinuclease ABC subunit B